MRIVGGIHCSRRLNTPKNDAVRPTTDKVRLAIFNMLHARDVVREAIVLDAFCGTGALGLEALSQGACRSIFFDKNKSSIMLVKENVALLREETRSDIFFQDATNPKDKPIEIPCATLVFLDPPYKKNFVPQAIENLIKKKWINKDAFLVIEVSKNEIIQSQLINVCDEKIYGDTKIILATLNNI